MTIINNCTIFFLSSVWSTVFGIVNVRETVSVIMHYTDASLIVQCNVLSDVNAPLQLADIVAIKLCSCCRPKNRRYKLDAAYYTYSVIQTYLN
jgi:hypothetical protein